MNIVGFIKRVRWWILLPVLWTTVLLAVFSYVIFITTPEDAPVLIGVFVMFVFMPALTTWTVAEEYFKRQDDNKEQAS